MTSCQSTTGRKRVSIGAVRHPECEEAILRAATEILEEQGYRAFSIQAVVKRAQSSKPSIYRRWRNKGLLIMAVYERLGEAAIVMPPPSSLRQELEEYLKCIWQWWRGSGSGEVLRSFITEAQLDPLSVAELRQSFVPRRARILYAIFNRARERGEISSQVNIDAAVALLMGASWLRLMTDNLSNVNENSAFVDVVLKGLMAV